MTGQPVVTKPIVTKPIVVGYDGSTGSGSALAWAIDEAARHGTNVRAVACYTAPVVTDAWGSIASAIQFDEELLQKEVTDHLDAEVRQALSQHASVGVVQEVVGLPARQVLADRSEGAELLVVGRAGAGGTLSLMLGSVAHAVARTSACPVVFVPHPLPAAAHDRIVVGIDGSPAAEAALDWAMAEATLRRAELVVVHAWWYTYGDAPESRIARDYTRLDAALVLDPALERARDALGVPVRGELLENEAAPALVWASDGADLVVVGSRGRGAFRTVLFGSVAHAVAERASCPVVVVREPKR